MVSRPFFIICDRQVQDSSVKKKGYFYEKEENVFKRYLTSTSQEEREELFNTSLLPVFTKMIESIIRRYKLYTPDEEFRETFDDTISFLMTKVNNFNPELGYKAYSYCGTICKNYLIYKVNQFTKNQKRNESYDEDADDSITDSIKYSYNSDASNTTTELIAETAKKIRETIDHREENSLSDNEVKVGEALIELMNHWEELFSTLGSNKFNKSSILLFLRETTLLSTKEIRDSMKKYKALYYILKKEKLEE